MNPWLVFIYKVPNEPSARRVYVWRKLKGMGAILIQDSAWVLPANARTREKLQWLAGEVNDMDAGEAILWEAGLVVGAKDDDLIQQFTDQTEARYKEILKQLEKKNPDLAALSRQYQQARLQDFFQSKLGQKARQALLERREASKT